MENIRPKKEMDVKDMEDDLEGMKYEYKQLQGKEKRWHQGTQRADFNTVKWSQECGIARKEIEDWEEEIKKAKRKLKEGLKKQSLSELAGIQGVVNRASKNS
jgi:hypothetical protein